MDSVTFRVKEVYPEVKITEYEKRTLAQDVSTILETAEKNNKPPAEASS